MKVDDVVVTLAAESLGLSEVPGLWYRNLESGLRIVPASPAKDCVCGNGCSHKWVDAEGKRLTCVGDSLHDPLVGERVEPAVDPMVVARNLGLPAVPKNWRQRLDGGAVLRWAADRACPRCHFLWHSRTGEVLDCACRSLDSIADLTEVSTSETIVR